MEYAENKWLLDSIKNEDHAMEFLNLDNVIPEKIYRYGLISN